MSRSRRRWVAGAAVLVAGLASPPSVASASAVASARYGGAHHAVPARPAAAATAPAAGDLFPVARTRIADTKSGLGISKGKIGRGMQRSVRVAGHGGVPATGAAAALLTITVSGGSASTAVTVWRGTGRRPAQPTLWVPKGATVATSALVPLAAGGIAIWNRSGAVHVALDVQGWVSNGVAATAGDRYAPVGPALLLDTATGRGAPKHALKSGRSLSVKVAGKPGVPASARSVTVTVGVTAGRKAAAVTVWPTGQTRPKSADVYAARGRTAITTLLTRVGKGGKLNLRTAGGSAQLFVVLHGYSLSSAQAPGQPHLQPLALARILDTTKGIGTTKKKLTSKARTLHVTRRGGVPGTARAVALNLTGLHAQRKSSITVWPAGSKKPTRPTLVVYPQQTVSVHALVRLPVGASGGNLLMAAAGSPVDLQADVQGAVLPPSPLQITTTSLPDGMENSEYSQRIHSTGGFGSTTWSLVAGALPAGVTLSATGLLSGSPTASGTSAFTVQVIDANRTTATRELLLTVASLGAPSITTTSLPGGKVDVSYDTTLNASGGAEPYFWDVQSGTFPSWANLDSDTGEISGFPDEAGTNTFVVRVTDDNGQSDTKELSITVVAFTITTSSLPDATKHVAYSATLTTANGTAPLTFVLQSGDLPEGLSLDSSSGAITGTPTGIAGPSDFTIEADDADFAVATKDLSITVIVTSAPPTISTASLPQGKVNVSYDATVSATNGDQPYVWDVQSGTFPSWASLNSDTGEISGFPDAAGTSTFVIRVTDDDNRSDTKQLSITVVAFSITTSSLPDATKDVAYSATITTSNGTAPVTFSVQSGALPDGLSLDTSSGAITGTPTGAEGTSDFTIEADDADFTVATKDLSISVSVSPTPVITTSALPDGELGVPYFFELGATGGQPPYTFVTTLGSLPAGLALSSGGVISGTPTADGSSSFTVQVTDNQSGTGSKAFATNVIGDSDWRQPGHDAGQKYDAAAESVVTPSNVGQLHKTWSTAAQTGTPAVSDGLVYATGNAPGEEEPALTAYNIADGSVAWEVATPCAGGSVAVTDTMVIFPCDGKLRAYDRDNAHALLWSTDAVDPTAQISSLAVLSDRVIGSDGSATYAYRLSDGVRLWKQLAPTDQFISGVAANESVTVVAGGDRVRAYNSSTGAKLWDALGSTNSVLIDGSAVYTTLDGKLTKLDLASGAQTWQVTTAPAQDPSLTPTSFLTVLAADGTNVYASWLQTDDFGATDRVAAFNESDHSLVWAIDDAPERTSSATIAGAVLYIAWHAVGNEGSDGGVYAYRLSDGSFLNSVIGDGKVFGSSVVAEGRMVLGYSGGQLQVVGFDPTLPDITTLALRSGHTTQAYSDQLEASGGTAPYTWAVTAGSLPSGLTMSSTGHISGTPTDIGTSVVTVQLTDDRGLHRDRQFTVQITGTTSTPWFTLGGDNDRRGLAGDATISLDNYQQLTQLWASTALPSGFVGGDIAVAAGYVVVPDENGLQAYSTTTGPTTARTASWSAHGDVPDGGTDPAPIESGVTISPDGTRALALGQDGLYSFSTSNGSKQWKYAASVNGFSLAPPVVVGTHVFVAINDALYSINLSTGTLAWGPVSLTTFGSWSLDLADPISSDGTRLFVVNGCTLYGIDASTGGPSWHRSLSPNGEDNCGVFAADTVPLYSDGVVYAGSYGGMGAFSASTGAVIWQRRVITGGAMALSNGLLITSLFVPDPFGYTPEPMALEAATGHTVWTDTAHAASYPARYAVTGDLVVVPTTDQQVSMLDIRTGDIVAFTSQVSGSSSLVPIGLTGGRIYFVAPDGTVHAWGVP